MIYIAQGYNSSLLFCKLRYVSKVTYCSHDSSWNFVSAFWNCATFIPQFRSDYKLFFPHFVNLSSENDFLQKVLEKLLRA